MHNSDKLFSLTTLLNDISQKSNFKLNIIASGHRSKNFEKEQGILEIKNLFYCELFEAFNRYYPNNNINFTKELDEIFDFNCVGNGSSDDDTPFWVWGIILATLPITYPIAVWAKGSDVINQWESFKKLCKQHLIKKATDLIRESEKQEEEFKNRFTDAQAKHSEN